jgi:hypothetical protein
MEPEACICICVCAIRILEPGLDVSDCAIRASYLDVLACKVLHAIVDNERAVRDFHSLGALTSKELRRECGHIRGNRRRA